jgi:hypothetical protein
MVIKGIDRKGKKEIAMGTAQGGRKERLWSIHRQ